MLGSHLLTITQCPEKYPETQVPEQQTATNGIQRSVPCPHLFSPARTYLRQASLQPLEEDAFAREHIAPKKGSARSSFFEAMNERGLEHWGHMQPLSI